MANPYRGPESELPPKFRLKRGSKSGSGSNVLGGVMMAIGGYLLAIFTGTAIHVTKNGMGDGSMPPVLVSIGMVVLGAIMLGGGYVLCKTWLRNSADPVSSFDLFSVLICDPVPLVIGIVYLFQGRSRGARLLLTHALILFIKLLVMALVWDSRY